MTIHSADLTLGTKKITDFYVNFRNFGFETTSNFGLGLKIKKYKNIYDLLNVVEKPMMLKHYNYFLNKVSFFVQGQVIFPPSYSVPLSTSSKIFFWLKYHKPVVSFFMNNF
ncbi:hypothetical protein BpHYR1_046839 [Brachionus plicatilis]|uniref:Uncharacterized protein n=1 Tax=Brachionus plicatilis TaxID=10195 RepID=A0A3M7S110_BRAPC|nr:hypothetical protein BpHYR1_046839 [Brachionus plicatilis]